MVISWILTHGFCQKGFITPGVMLVFASLDDCGSFLSVEITPAFLDTARIDIVYEALTILPTITKVERLT